MLKGQSAFFDYLCYQKRYNKNDNSVVYNSSSNKYFLIIFLIFLLFTSIKNVSSDPISQPPAATITGPTGTWSLRAIPHQSTSSLLSSLNEHIQNLKYGWESSIDQLTRKIEMLESKIGRLDTSNQLRLEKLTESVNSKEIKDELAMEQLMRKIEGNYDRVNHKLSYLMETRLDTSLNKIQANLDNSINRLESRQSDMESEISDIGQSIEEIKSLTIKLDDKHNNTQKSVQQHLQTIISESASRDQMDKLAGTIENIGNKLNDTNYAINPSNQNQNDASGQTVSDSDRIIQILKSEVGHEGHRIENKISNMYNELWRRFISLETTVKTVTAQSNTTRRQLQEDFRAFLQLEKQRFTEPDSQENYIEILIEALGNMVQELTRNVESNFQMVVTKQNLFIDNCHRLQLGEPQLETKISRVLERILNTITNKTMRVDNRIVEVMEMIKSHQSQVMRNLAHSTKMIVQLTEETNENAKHLEMALFGLAERNEIVAIKAQELQDEIQILTNITTMKYNIENENLYQPLNRTINNNNNNNKEIQNQIQPTKPPSTSIEEKEKMKNTGMKLEQIAQNAKYPETSDEVIKIFTEDENNMFENNNNNNNNNNLSSTVINNNEDELISNEETQNTNKGKKISIILPNKYYNLIENNTGQLLYNNKLYTLLLKDILNQTGQTINVDDIGAIILNTEADGNNKTIEENLDETNQQTYQNDLNFINTTITNDAKYFNERLSNSNETEQKINTENNKTKQINISDLYKQRLDLYKNHKIKFNYNRNNSSPMSTNLNRNIMLQNILQYQNNSTDNFTKIMQHFRKRKSQNLSKTFGAGISDEMNNNKPYDIEPIKESDASLPSDKINEQIVKTIDDMTSLNSGETSILNTEDSTSNFDDSNIKYFKGDNTDLSNIYGGEHRDTYSDY